DTTPSEVEEREEAVYTAIEAMISLQTNLGQILEIFHAQSQAEGESEREAASDAQRYREREAEREREREEERLALEREEEEERERERERAEAEKEARRIRRRERQKQLEKDVQQIGLDQIDISESLGASVWNMVPYDQFDQSLSVIESDGSDDGHMGDRGEMGAHIDEFNTPSEREGEGEEEGEGEGSLSDTVGTPPVYHHEGGREREREPYAEVDGDGYGEGYTPSEDEHIEREGECTETTEGDSHLLDDDAEYAAMVQRDREERELQEQMEREERERERALLAEVEREEQIFLAERERQEREREEKELREEREREEREMEEAEREWEREQQAELERERERSAPGDDVGASAFFDGLDDDSVLGTQPDQSLGLSDQSGVQPQIELHVPEAAETYSASMTDTGARASLVPPVSPARPSMSDARPSMSERERESRVGRRGMTLPPADMDEGERETLPITPLDEGEGEREEGPAYDMMGDEEEARYRDLYGSGDDDAETERETEGERDRVSGGSDTARHTTPPQGGWGDEREDREEREDVTSARPRRRMGAPPSALGGEREREGEREYPDVPTEYAEEAFDRAYGEGERGDSGREREERDGGSVSPRRSISPSPEREEEREGEGEGEGEGERPVTVVQTERYAMLDIPSSDKIPPTSPGNGIEVPLDVLNRLEKRRDAFLGQAKQK
ncbi:hypothetical protein KIPB_009438, partial [Kipferlia bialata]